MNDRQLRFVVDGLGGKANGTPREDGYDITVASEIMAVLCLASDINDLKARLARLVVGYTRDGKPVTAGDLKAQGAMAALLEGRSEAQPGSDAGTYPRFRTWRSLRQHRPRLQLRHCHQDRHAAG